MKLPRGHENAATKGYESLPYSALLNQHEDYDTHGLSVLVTEFGVSKVGNALSLSESMISDVHVNSIGRRADYSCRPSVCFHTTHIALRVRHPLCPLLSLGVLV